MSIFTAARLSRAPMASLTAFGAFWGVFAAYVPEFKLRAGASDSQLGLALMMSAIGGMASMWLAPTLAKRLGRFMMPLAATVLVLATAVPLTIHSVASLAVAILVMGACLSALDMGANLRLSVLEARHGMHLMNLSHAMFSFGFGGAALAASLARRAGVAPETVFPVLGLALLPLVAATIERRDWQGAPDAPADAGHDGVWAAILPAAAILFAAFVSENAADAFSALHIERTLGGAAGDGGFGPMMLGLAMGVGRLSGQFAAARLGEAGLIFWSSVAGIVGAVVTALAPTPLAGIAGVGLLGLGVAVTVPSANSILGKLVRPDQRGYAISRAWMVGFTGFFVGPTLVGRISDLAGLRLSFALIALVMATILISVRRMARLAGRAGVQL